jgi:tetratricopeptide (TPR) repeat protein
LGCHTRALALRQSDQSPDQSLDQAAIASNFVGIANAHWSRREYLEAIDNTQRALAIRESLVPLNEASLGATLAMLGNIYQDSGNIGLALDLCKKALAIFEHTLSADSPIIAELLYTLGTMQLDTELLDDAYHNFERVVKIYKKLLPHGHPDRIAAENDLRRVIHLHQKNMKKLQKQS